MPTQSTSPTPDPFTWTRYTAASGSTIYLPSTWRPLDPRAYATTSVAFAASPENASMPLNDHQVLVTVRVLTGPTPFTSVGAFADAIQRGVFAGIDVIRETGGHPTGPVVFLKYVEQPASGPVAQETDALFVVGGAGFILGTRSPVDRWQQNAGVFRQIFERFRPS